MISRSELRRHWPYTLWCTGFLVLAGLSLLLLPVGKGLILWSYDLPFVLRPNPKIDDVVIVYLDDQSHDMLGQPHDRRWDRSLHARFLDRLRVDQARLVVFDIIFDEAGENPEADQAFAKAIQESGRVVLGANLVESEQPGGVKIKTTFPPVDPFRRTAAAWGFVQLPADPDYGVRRHYHQVDDSLSLSLQAAKFLGAKAEKLPRSSGNNLWLNHYGPPDSIVNLSYYLVLEPEGLLKGFFKDKIVFVGARQSVGYTGQYKDEFLTPYTWWTGRFSPGVDVHATAFLNLVRQDWLVAIPRAGQVLILVCTGVFFGCLFSLLRPGLSVTLAVGGACGLILLSLLVFWKFRLWYAWLIPVAVQVPLGLVGAIFFSSIRSFEGRRHLEESLALHVSRSRVKQLLKQPEQLRPGAEKQMISIMFTDIDGFSKISERKEAMEVVNLLNEYFERALAYIHETDGTVIKLIGDAIFAIWNAPLPQPDHKERACRSALVLRDRLANFQREKRTLPMRTRIGLHSGEACVGNIGSSTRFDYTAIGDAINLASRLEGLNKHLGTEILATSSIYAAAKECFVSRVVGHFRFKGFDKVIEVHELVGTTAKADESAPWRDSFGDALYHFQRRGWDAARDLLQKTLTLQPGDGPSLYYLDLIQKLISDPPDNEWKGEVDMSEK